jgi:hypothetical protein
MYFVWRCQFLYCSEEKGCMDGGGGGYSYVMLLYVPLGEGGGGSIIHRLFFADFFLVQHLCYSRKTIRWANSIGELCVRSTCSLRIAYC